jgi:hypothetical protein
MRLFRSARWLLLALFASLLPASSYAGVFISVNFGPPVLPIYVQPVCPAPDLIWTPGYWAYGADGYFWVPGAWVPAPFSGGLWTPAYWGWSGGQYLFHPGYWGYHVGYYGGVNYGGGYLGIGFSGGEWRGGHMAYNTAVVNVNTRIIHTTFIDRTVIQRNTVMNPGHVAYAGGPGGINHAAAPEERVAERETHTPPTTFQSQHIQSAQSNRTSYAKNNGGHPTMLAAAKPLPVESHPAPPRTAVNAGHPATGNTPSHLNANPTLERHADPLPPHTNPVPTHTNTVPTSTTHPGTVAPHTPVAPRTYTPPKTNTAPRTAPAPRTASKPKPEGHEK